MRLGIDLDGVVADFNAGWMKLHGDEFGTTLTPDLVTRWDNLHELGGFDDMAAFWRWARGNGSRPSIFRHLDLHPGAVETLRELVGDGHDVVIVTAKPRWAHRDTLEWLVDNDIPAAEVHMTFDKHEVACDVYLDDSPHVLPDLVKHRPEAHVCRFVRAWNRPVEGAVDVEDWEQFHQFVTKQSPG